MKLINKLIGAFALLAVFASCDKTEPYDVAVPAPRVHFVGDALQLYSMQNATPDVYNVVVGSTDVSSSDRTVTYRISSPTGAVAGTHYTVAGGGATGTVTIPAGQALVNIPIQGIYAPYDGTGRKDTLVITLEEPSIKSATFMNEVKLVLRGPCFEGDVNIADFLGTYANTNETFSTSAYGPYTTAVATAVPTGPTSATIVVTNIWDNGWGPITFNLNWSDPTARTAIVVPQAAIPGSNAGDINPAYAGMTIAVRGFAANPGTFSACTGTLTLRMQLGVTGLGYFAPVYTVNMAR